MTEKRLKQHRKNSKLEALLKEVNELLSPVENQAILNFQKNKFPIILIMGAARSGTTLLLQMLADSGCFAYPTNILSRFYKAPYIGAKIQLMLTEYDFNNEIFNDNNKVEFYSILGKTKGPLAPHEFWYFWRRFFKFEEIQVLDNLDSINGKEFVAELAAIENQLGKPLAMKGMIVNWHIPYINKILDKVLFVHIKRKPFYHIQSLLEARKKYYGSIESWYSFKPPEYRFLKDLNPYEQVSGQIYYTDKAIQEGISKISSSKSITITYENLCKSPKALFKKIEEKMKLQNYDLNFNYKLPKSFILSNEIRLNMEEREKVVNAFEKITNKKITF